MTFDSSNPTNAGFGSWLKASFNGGKFTYRSTAHSQPHFQTARSRQNEFSTIFQFTHFIRPGNHVIKNSNGSTTTAINGDGSSAVVVHANIRMLSAWLWCDSHPEGAAAVGRSGGGESGGESVMGKKRVNVVIAKDMIQEQELIFGRLWTSQDAATDLSEGTSLLTNAALHRMDPMWSGLFQKGGRISIFFMRVMENILTKVDNFVEDRAASLSGKNHIHNPSSRNTSGGTAQWYENRNVLVHNLNELFSLDRELNGKGKQKRGIIQEGREHKDNYTLYMTLSETKLDFLMSKNVPSYSLNPKRQTIAAAPVTRPQNNPKQEVCYYISLGKFLNSTIGYYPLKVHIWNPWTWTRTTLQALYPRALAPHTRLMEDIHRYWNIASDELVQLDPTVAVT
ncbi:hypothetical protein BJ742DRAFT_740692 [Cladochytrium replicatum]|nr:hypothetical protein BJ742DRAFT_740692 [Cladochytrium replicatum]